jgi:hypothetical protein
MYVYILYIFMYVYVYVCIIYMYVCVRILCILKYDEIRRLLLETKKIEEKIGEIHIFIYVHA